MALWKRITSLMVATLLTGCLPDVNSDWMAPYQDRTLGQLTLPASHDAGMARNGLETALTACKGGAFYNIALTQTYDILDQLKAGVRAFDIRPVIHNGKLFTAHGTHEKIDALGLQLNAGCHGQPMDRVFAQVKTFLDKHPTEVVILNVSHIGYMSGMFSSDTPQQVAAKTRESAVAALGDLLVRPQDLPADAYHSNLWDVRLGDLVAQNRRAVINMECGYGDASKGLLECVSAQSGQARPMELGELTGSWANSPFADTVMTRVEQSWSDYVASTATNGFDFSWTATQDTPCIAASVSYQVFGVPLSGLPAVIRDALSRAGVQTSGYDQCRSIKTISQPLHDAMAAKFAAYRSSGVFCPERRPRLVSMDFSDPAVAGIVIGLNDLASYPGAPACAP